MAEIRSDILDGIRGFAELFPPLERILGKPIRVRVIVDACIINSELRWLLGKRRNSEARTNLQELIDSGTLIAYAPDFLEEELKEHYPEIASEVGVSTDEVHQEWLRYKSRLKLFTPQSKLPKRTTISDKDDIQYGVAFHEVAANALLTEDKGFDESGIPVISKELVIELRNYSRGSAPHFALFYGGAMLGLVAGSALEDLIKITPELIQQIGNIPKPVKLICLLAVLIVILHPKSRNAIVQALSVFFQDAADSLLWASDEFGDYLQRASEQKNNAELALERVNLGNLKPDAPLWRHAIMILIERKKPISIERLSELVIESGYTSESKDFTGYLERVMRKKPHFIQYPDGRWGLVYWQRKRKVD